MGAQSIYTQGANSVLGKVTLEGRRGSGTAGV